MEMYVYVSHGTESFLRHLTIVKLKRNLILSLSVRAPHVFFFHFKN